MAFARRFRIVLSAALALALGACSHSASATHAAQEQLPPASASMALVEARQQVKHGHPCPTNFLPSEGPGDWCYQAGKSLLRPDDVVAKTVFRDRNHQSWAIMLSLRPDAAKRFAALSGSHSGSDTAIVVDGTVIASIPAPSTSGVDSPATPFWTLNGLGTEAQVRRVARSFGGVEVANLADMPPTPKPIAQG